MQKVQAFYLQRTPSKRDLSLKSEKKKPACVARKKRTDPPMRAGGVRKKKEFDWRLSHRRRGKGNQ